MYNTSARRTNTPRRPAPPLRVRIRRRPGPAGAWPGRGPHDRSSRHRRVHRRPPRRRASGAPGGIPKGLLTVAGEPIAARTLRLFRELFGAALIAANDPAPYEALGRRWWRTSCRGRARRAPARRALHRLDRVGLRAACDMPFLSREPIVALAALRAGADAVLVRAGGRLEPLHAFWSRACLPVLDRMVRSGDPPCGTSPPRCERGWWRRRSGGPRCLRPLPREREHAGGPPAARPLRRSRGARPRSGVASAARETFFMDLTAHVNESRQRYVDELVEFLRIPPSAPPPPTHPRSPGPPSSCAPRWPARDRGPDLPTAGHPVVYGEWLGAGAGARTILVYGHYDVQPVDRSSCGTRRPSSRRCGPGTSTRAARWTTRDRCGCTSRPSRPGGRRAAHP